ncbi:hypothetical protein AB1Y20_010068 [Prymnesium parvum]|uniref:Uncharacterized protein n=1 Tax=Prymnesium parvum TaxID=97485 RepID=A0AB34K3B8_PRYPA
MLQRLNSSACAVIELLVFSGTPNPLIHLNHTDAHTLCAIVGSTPQPPPPCRVVGFTGWKLGDGTVWHGVDSIDAVLLRQPSFHALGRTVREHVQTEIELKGRGCAHSDEETPSCPQHEKAPADVCGVARCDSSACPCGCECGNATDPGVCYVPAHASARPRALTCASVPIIGPDDPSKVRFAPQADDGGCFVAKQSENNCYDYATDIVTNTFAQPGRGSGVCPKSQRPCVKNACDDVRHAAESDGLAWVGTQLPSALPTEGHYVSLHIWPQTNFHWLRMDADLRWSHKPGGSPVRNVDNNGQVILDPSKADVSPWSEHCGYMHVLPSNVSIY